MIEIVLKPHLERGGYHLDRYDAYVDGTHLMVSRQPLLDGARRLFTMGHPVSTEVTMRHASKPHASFSPRSIQDLMGWTITERDKGGLSRERWQPHPCAGSDTP